MKRETTEEREKRIRDLYSKGPVRSGKVYCSLWCGAGCTKAAFDKATKQAKALAKKLGEGWKPRVHENMGWFWGAEKGVLDVSPNIFHGAVVGYTAYLNTTPQFIADDLDPRSAVQKSIRLLDAHIVSVRRQRKKIAA